MQAEYLTPTCTLYLGDARSILPTLPPASVHCCVTSPPYWGLRDYGTGTWEGGDPKCEHKVGRFTTPHSAKQGSNAGSGDMSAREVCPKCGARRIDQQLGLEKTPEEYVARLVGIFREVRRVLRDDGTVWLVLGDSYGAGGGKQVVQTKNASHGLDGMRGCQSVGSKQLAGIPWRVAFALQQPYLCCKGCGHVAHQSAWGKWPNGRLICPACKKSKGYTVETPGWYLRQDIIWSKPNPMTESVRDRCTKAHEYIFLLSKSARYYYDNEAVKETAVGGASGNCERKQRPSADVLRRGAVAGSVPWAGAPTRNRRSVWTIATVSYKGAHFATYPPALIRPCILAGTSERGCCPECGKPWERVVEKGLAAHDGTTASQYPAGTTAKRLALLRQASRERGGEYVSGVVTLGWRPGCSCGAPAGTRPDDVEIVYSPTGERAGDDPTLFIGMAGYNRPRGENEGRRPITRYEQRHYAAQLRASEYRAEMAMEAGPAFAHYLRTDRSGARPIPAILLEKWIASGWIERVTVPAWEPPAAPVPCTVIDPFTGSGTTGQVAMEEGRRAILIELNPEYGDLIRERVGKVTPRLLSGCCKEDGL